MCVLAPSPPIADYNLSVWIFCFCAIAETLYEPLFILCMGSMRFRERTIVESLAIVVRCVTLFVCVAVFDMGLLAFATAQVLLTLELVGAYYFFFARSVARGDGYLAVYSFSQLFPHRINDNAWFDAELSSLTFSFLKQSVLKYVLSEGDRVVLSLFSSSYNQGMYGIVYNYGSLVARLLFAPLEEISRTTFPNMLHKESAQTESEQKHSWRLALLVR